MINIKQEYIRCFQDKTRIYFIENYLSTFNAMERKEVPFKLFPRQKAYLKSCAEYSNTIAKKHRQSGVSTISSAWACGQCVFAKKGSPETVLCIANKLEQAVELLNKIGAFLDQVPRWMWGNDFYSPDPESQKNMRSIYIKRNKNYIELFNGCKIYARASSPNAARGISSVGILILDEAAFIADSVDAFTAAVAAQSTVKDPKCLMVSTPNGKDQLYYKTYIQAVKGENNFHVVEFKWYQDPRYNRFLKWYRKNDKTGETEWDVDTVIDKLGNIVYNEERWAELDKNGWTATSPWFENMCKSFNNDSQKIAQELLVSFLGSSDNVVPVEVIEAQNRQNVIKITDDWKLRDVFVKDTWIWEDPNPEHRYIMAVDPSSGSGDDSSSIEIIDVDAIDENGTPYFNQVLEYNGKMNGEEIGMLADRYGRVYNNALAVVECIGGYGDAVVLTMKNLNYPNLYYDETTSLKTYTNDYAKKLFNKKDDEKLPGFRSNALRIQMISNFVELLKSNVFRVRSERVISELDTWIFKNGRPDHMDGAHDDNLTCLAMCLFVLQYYMLKTDKLKKKDSCIVQSWVVNNSDNTDLNTKHLRDNVSISNRKEMARKFSPFGNSQKEDEGRFIKACIMLGGYTLKK